MNISISYPIDMTRHILTQGFGENPQLYKQFIVKGIPLQGHNGLDYAQHSGNSDQVLAAAPGKVIKLTYELGGYGQYVVIQHEGFRTLYAHLSSFFAYVNFIVDTGDAIALTGTTGFSSGVHLHFGLYPDGEPALNGYGGAVNPMPYYGKGENFKPSGTLEYAINPTGNSIFIVRPNKWRKPAKARRK